MFIKIHFNKKIYDLWNSNILDILRAKYLSPKEIKAILLMYFGKTLFCFEDFQILLK